MMYGYRLVVAKITFVDVEENKFKAMPFGNDPTITEIYVDAGNGLKMIRPYAPLRKFGGDDIHFFDPVTEDALNFVTGMVNLPSVGDVVVLGIYYHVATSGTIRTQNPGEEVIMLGYLSWERNFIGQHENMILDKSGAKIHFNDVWLDEDNLIGTDEVQEPALTGHLTIVGNRTVHLMGKRFLPFGALGHNLKRPDGNIFGYQNEVAEWKTIFTRERFATIPAENTDLYNINFTSPATGRNTKKFLEPPSINPDESMRLHESGWKEHIHNDASHVAFLRSRVRLFGESFLGLSFSPTAVESDGTVIDSINDDFDEDERNIINEISGDKVGDAGYADYFRLNSRYTAYRRGVKGEGLVEDLNTGMAINIDSATNMPSTLTLAKSGIFNLAAKAAESGKYKVIVGNAKIIIDIATDDITLTDGSVTLSIIDGVVDVT